jgi:hypothetical protein
LAVTACRRQIQGHNVADYGHRSQLFGLDSSSKTLGVVPARTGVDVCRSFGAAVSRKDKLEML